MDEHNAALFQRMREKCRRRHWYGPDGDDPFEKQRVIREASPDSHAAYYWYDRDGKQFKIDKDTDLSRFPLLDKFAFSPATEEQVSATEQALGFALPELLRELYTTAANGGFGPGYGLNGIAGGFGNTLANSYHARKRSSRLIDITLYEKRQAPTKLLETAFYIHPYRFLELCHWGCAIFFYLDCVADRVFRGSAYREFYGFRYETASLYEWLDRWSRDQLEF